MPLAGDMNRSVGNCHPTSTTIAAIVRNTLSNDIQRRHPVRTCTALPAFAAGSRRAVVEPPDAGEAAGEAGLLACMALSADDLIDLDVHRLGGTRIDLAAAALQIARRSDGLPALGQARLDDHLLEIRELAVR